MSGTSKQRGGMSIIGNNQVGGAVAGTTTLTGLLTNLGITPDSMGILATLVGIILTLVMLWGQVKRIKNESEERKEKAKIAKLAESEALLRLDKLRREISKVAH